MASSGQTSCSRSFNCVRSTGSSSAMTAVGLKTLMGAAWSGMDRRPDASRLRWRLELDDQYARTALAGIFDFMGFSLAPEYVPELSFTIARGPVRCRRTTLPVL